MKTMKWLKCALLGVGLVLPMADIWATTALAEDTATADQSLFIRQTRHDRHNRQWRRAKLRARQAMRHGHARDVVRAFKSELNNTDIVVNVCVINIINKADNVVSIGGDVNQVINLIDSANCEIH